LSTFTLENRGMDHAGLEPDASRVLVPPAVSGGFVGRSRPAGEPPIEDARWSQAGSNQAPLAFPGHHWTCFAEGDIHKGADYVKARIIDLLE
jgi:hypothetical protein